MCQRASVKWWRSLRWSVNCLNLQKHWQQIIFLRSTQIAKNSTKNGIQFSHPHRKRTIPLWTWWTGHSNTSGIFICVCKGTRWGQLEEVVMQNGTFKVHQRHGIDTWGRWFKNDVMACWCIIWSSRWCAWTHKWNTQQKCQCKINGKSSVETEVTGADDALPQVLWTNWFMKTQGWSHNTTIHQDNKIVTSLESNGRLSSDNGTKHINIRHCFIEDVIERREVNVEHLSADKMWSDCFCKATARQEIHCT